MYWLKRDMRKAGIASAGTLLLLVLMIGIPVSAVGAYEGTSGLATSGMGTAQATPTEDATVSALNKEKLEQEVQQLKNQNEPDFLGWLRTNASILLSTLVIVIGGLIGLFRWLGDRRDEREKRAEERFQSAVTGLGNEKEGARIGAAILLRTFLRPGYEPFYIQTFDLAVANLCPTETANPPENTKTPLPLTILRQALIVVFNKAKGAIIDEDPMTSSSQSAASPLPPSHSNDAQAQSIPSAHESIPIADLGPKNTLGKGSTAVSDQKQ